MTDKNNRSGFLEKSGGDQGHDTRDYYLRLFDDFPNPIWRAGLDAKCNYFNREWLAFTGRTLAEELGDGWTEGVHPEDFDRCQKTWLGAFARREPFEMEYRLRYHDGSYHWLLDTGKPYYTPDGIFAGFIGSCYDINARKQAAVALQESEKRYRDMVENLSEVIISLDREGKFLYISPVATRLYGYSPADMTGQYFLQYVHPDDRDRVTDIFGQELSGKYRPEEFRILARDGSTRWISISPRPLEQEGRIAGFNYALADITERKRSEDEEQLTRERFETLVRVAGMQDASEQELSEFVMQAACHMTASTLAFIGTMTPDESVMDIISWSASVMDECQVRLSPLHFPIQNAGLWADAVREHRPTIVNDYTGAHPGKKGLPAGHVKITRFLSLPVIDNGKVVMVAAVANKPDDYDEADVTRLTLLMQGIWGNLRKRRADEAIRKSEALLNDVGRLAQIGGWELDITTKVVVMTAESYHISEIPEGEILDMVRAVRHFDLPGRAALESVLLRCMESGEPFDLELPFTTETGRHIWTRSIGRAIRDDGKTVKITGTLQDITERRKAEESLRESRQLLEAVLNAITFRVFWKDRNLVFLGCNTAFARDAGYEKPEEVIGKDDFSMSWRENARGYIADDRKVMETGLEKLLFEEPQTIPSGEERYLLTSKVPLRDAGGNVIGVLGTYLDITERKKAEAVLRDFNRQLEEQVKAQTETINASLDEKVLLLREIHHRVKNNLQLIISLTNLQMRQSTDEQLIQIMKETQNRVRAMSLVHEKLYQSEDIARISLADYTRFLATQIFSFYGVNTRQVKLTIDIGRIMLDINTAIPTGLIINELVSNALKHAFPDTMAGEVLIRAREEGNTITLLVCDTGVGMPRDFDWKACQTLGLRLVRILSEQLNGTIELLPVEKGTTFFIRLTKAKGSEGVGR